MFKDFKALHEQQEPLILGNVWNAFISGIYNSINNTLDLSINDIKADQSFKSII